MAINWDEVRYRGDRADVDEMFKTYRVEDYLNAFEENRRQADQGIRDRLMKDGIKLTEKLSPRIYGIFRDACRRLEVSAEVEVFCLPSAEVNAFATLDFRASGHSLLGITAGALEKLDDGELQSVLGHELGHFLFGHNRLMALVSTDHANPSCTVLPPLGESLFLRWRKKSEISADRAALLACGNFFESAKGLLKATFGLSDRNLNLDVEALLGQLEEIQGRPELMEENFASHPLLPVRLKALHMFSQSKKAAAVGFQTSDPLIGDDELENAIDQLLLLTRRYPHKPVYQAIARAIALAGALLLSADGDISNEEVKILIQILHHYFTDEPECFIETDRKIIMEQLPITLKLIKEQGDGDDRLFILSRLSDIALADGALMEQEGSVILEMAEALEVPSREAYAIMVGAAQTMGFRVDVKLNRIAEGLRRSFTTGFTAPRPKAHGHRATDRLTS